MILLDRSKKKQLSSDESSGPARPKNASKSRVDAVSEQAASSRAHTVKTDFTEVVPRPPASASQPGSRKPKHSSKSSKKSNVSGSEATADSAKRGTGNGNGAPTASDQRVDSDVFAERLAASLDHLEGNLDNIARLKPLAAATSSYGDRLGIWINGESKRLRLCCHQILIERVEQDGKARIRMNPSPCNMRVACPICGDYWTVRNRKRITSDTLSVLELHPNALIYFVTIVPPKADRELLPPLEQVIEVLKWLSDRCRIANKKRRHRGTNPKTQMAKVLGGLEYIEFPKVRAKNRRSMLWLPHVHGIWAASSPIDVDSLRAEIRMKFGPGYQIALTQPDADAAFLKHIGYSGENPFKLTQRQAAQRRTNIVTDLARLADYFTKELDVDELVVEAEPGEAEETPEIDFAEAKRRLMAYNSLRPVEEYVDPATGEIRKRRKRCPAIVKTFGCFWGLKSRLERAAASDTVFSIVKVRPDGTRVGVKRKPLVPAPKPVVTARIELRYWRGKGYQQPARRGPRRLLGQQIAEIDRGPSSNR